MFSFKVKQWKERAQSLDQSKKIYSNKKEKKREMIANWQGIVKLLPFQIAMGRSRPEDDYGLESDLDFY